jgi:hypothetical protein
MTVQTAAWMLSAFSRRVNATVSVPGERRRARDA